MPEHLLQEDGLNFVQLSVPNMLIDIDQVGPIF